MRERPLLGLLLSIAACDCGAHPGVILRLPMNILRTGLVSTAITVIGTPFPQFVARARHTTVHGKPWDISTVRMTLTRAVELAAEAARQTWVQQLP
jgi:hypothetical protein